MAKIPEIQRGIISSIMPELLGPQKDPHWIENFFTKLQIKNPVVADYLAQVKEQYGEQAALVGLVMYRLIESQMEADELEELFSE